MTPGHMTDLRDAWGDIDIYLFDQLLRGRIVPGMTVLEAGCGDGRNLVHLLRAGYTVFAVDEQPEAVDSVRRLAATLAPQLPADHFQVATIETMAFPDACADAVLAIAVLHFARDEAHFERMLRGLWRVLRPGGLLLCRLASSIGIEARVVQLEGRRCRLPDGTQRFLVDEALLLHLTGELGAQLLDPLKTTIVQDRRAMTTWVLRRGAR